MRLAVGAIIGLGMVQATGAAPSFPSDKRSESANMTAKFHFYEFPTPNAGLCDLCTSPDGTKLYGQTFSAQTLFELDPATGAIREFDIAYSLPQSPTKLPSVKGRVVMACAIRPGADGNIYATNGLYNQIAKFNPTTSVLEVFSLGPGIDGPGETQPFNDMWSGPDGMYITQTNGNSLLYFSYDGGGMSVFKSGVGPLGVHYLSNDTVWVTDFAGNSLTRFEDGDESTFILPTQDSTPASMRALVGGNLYFTEPALNHIGEITSKGVYTSYANDVPGAIPVQDTNDHNGRVWFTAYAPTTQLNYLDTKTGKFSHIPMSGGSESEGVPVDINMAINYGPGNIIWFTLPSTNQVGAYNLS